MHIWLNLHLILEYVGLSVCAKFSLRLAEDNTIFEEKDVAVMSSLRDFDLRNFLPYCEMALENKHIDTIISRMILSNPYSHLSSCQPANKEVQGITIQYLSNGFTKPLERCRVILNHGQMMQVLCTPRQAGNNGKGVLQQATVLSTFCFVPDQFLKRQKWKLLTGCIESNNYDKIILLFVCFVFYCLCVNIF